PGRDHLHQGRPLRLRQAGPDDADHKGRRFRGGRLNPTCRACAPAAPVQPAQKPPAGLLCFKECGLLAMSPCPFCTEDVMASRYFSPSIGNWPEDAREAAQLVVDQYGEPDEVTDSWISWHQPGPWKRIVASRQ